MKRYVDASIPKRLGAFILDLCLVILSATIILIGCIKFFSNTQLVKEANNKINQIQINSHLYVFDEDNMTMVVEEEKYSIAIKNYYLNFKNDEETYNKKMVESKLFNYIDGEYVAKKNIDEKDVKEFYRIMMGEAILEIKNIEDYKKSSDIIIGIEFYSIVISILISYIIFIILIPIFRKNRNTIGQRALNLTLINSGDNQVPTKTQIAFRAIIILIIEVLIGINTFGIPVIISVGFILFRLDHASYHDLLSSTRMIDYHYVELDDTRKKGNK